MTRIMLNWAIVAPALFLLTACGGDPSGSKNSPDEAPAHQDRHDHGKGGHGSAQDRSEPHESGDHVELSLDDATTAGIVLGKASSGRIVQSIRLPAEIRFDADRVARISPNVEGVVSRLYAGEGDAVKAGAALAMLTSRELAGLKADYLSAQTAEKLAAAELQREERLFAQSITAEADVQSARAAHDAANARREAAENRLHAIGIGHEVLDELDTAADGVLAQAYMTSPIDGRVIRRSVSLGETVGIGNDPIFVIVDDSVVWADIAVYKEDLDRLDVGLPVAIRQERGRLLADGTIAVILPVIDEASRTATARVVVDNSSGRLKPGQFATAHIETGEMIRSVQVPSDAIVDIEGQRSVFVPTDEGFEPRPVEPGERSNGFTQILSGLADGEVIVIEGAFTLKAQLEKDAFGDGHAH